MTFAIDVETGIGKTTIATEELDRSGDTAVIFVPTHGSAMPLSSNICPMRGFFMAAKLRRRATESARCATTSHKCERRSKPVSRSRRAAATAR